MSRRVIAALAVAVIAAVASQAEAAVPRPRSPRDLRAAQGLVYTGLRKAATGTCRGGYALARHRNLCTAGPDAAPAGVDVRWTSSRAPYRPVSGTAPARAAACGSDGPRVQLVYARASDVADRYSSLVSLFQLYAKTADTVFSNSAAAAGAIRHVRYQTNSACVPAIARVTMGATGDDNFSSTIAELKANGFNRTDRKYLVWVDSAVYCGIGTVIGDDSPGATNANNRGPSYSRVDRGCWGGYTEAHELAHNLGAVQLSAPHSSGGWHCTDESDRMCYRDGSTVTMTNACPPSQENLLDCNHDDYFHPAPPRGSYLDTHWNIARSVYLTTS